MSERESLLIVSPVRNEATHISRVVRAMAQQSRPPDLWLVADDSSDDGTPEILRSLEAEVPFMRVVAIPPSPPAGPDRLALALEARAFNSALRQADWKRFSHLGKLDGDIELPRDYFETLLTWLRGESSLGICGGSIVEPGPGERWVASSAPPHHVHGALKLYSRECFEAIGGIAERLGWDTIDETYARMRGYETRRRPELVARHHRPSGSADGRLRGRARHGECAYITHYGPLWILMRSVKIGIEWRPRGLSGFAFLLGYVRAALRRSPRVEDAEFRGFVRQELRSRMREAVTRVSRNRATPKVAAAPPR
jgi:glycosyltransferase involved in cell wall biosynthesis